MTLLILYLIWNFSAMFLFLTHPLSLGLILLIQTILISLLTGMMNYNYWFSYILFLIFVGGILILFIYMTSIASNEKFKFSYKLSILLFFSILLLIPIYFTDPYLLNMNLKNYELMNQNMNLWNLSMNNYFNWPKIMILYLIITFLLLTLIMAVKVTNINYGPLRQKF
nr:NADH dehydrogenase subunit 6 [Vesperus sanzi]